MAIHCTPYLRAPLLTLSALLGVGTSVVPINPRHPLIVASLAQTAQAAAHGNFSLGLGLGAHEPERLAFGTAWPNTINRLREHLHSCGRSSTPDWSTFTARN
jgi:alkanesulfonate monooxygenase SsuD/methylene tetrahydromethanopterin reductase-like flavin-dependent oxidoreductase (luciferase family)